jgi:hypothetical protein
MPSSPLSLPCRQLPNISPFPQWRPTDHHKSPLTRLSHPADSQMHCSSPLPQYSLKSSCLSPFCCVVNPTSPTNSPCSTPTTRMATTPYSSTCPLNPTLPTSTPSNTGATAMSAGVLFTTHMNVNLQVPVSLLLLLGLFLLLYWSRIATTHGSTSLLFVLICTHIGTRIAIAIRLSFAFYLRLPYCYGFHLDLTILILLL